MTFAPENPLEASLMRAANEPAIRPEFYRLLLETELLVIGRVEDEEGVAIETGNNAAGQRVRIANIPHNGKSYIPVFSSLLRLRAFLRSEEDYFIMTGRGLFTHLPGSHFMLNPGSDYGKELLPDEIGSLLNPTVPQSYTVEKPTEVRIGPLSEYPTSLVQSLTGLFRERPDVVSARIVQIQFEERGEPNPLIGIETVGAWDPLAAEIGQIVAVIAPGKTVDLIPLSRIKKSDSLNATVLQTSPFYTRARAPH